MRYYFKSRYPALYWHGSWISCQLMECTQYYRCIEHKEIKVVDFVKQRCFIYLKIIKNKKLCTSILSSKKSNFHQLGAKNKKLLWFSAKVWSLSRLTEINSYDFLQKVDHDWRKINSYDPLRRLPHQLSDAQKLRKTTALIKSTILYMKFIDLKE